MKTTENQSIQVSTALQLELRRQTSFADDLLELSIKDYRNLLEGSCNLYNQLAKGICFFDKTGFLSLGFHDDSNQINFLEFTLVECSHVDFFDETKHV